MFLVLDIILAIMLIVVSIALLKSRTEVKRKDRLFELGQQAYASDIERLEVRLKIQKAATQGAVGQLHEKQAEYAALDQGMTELGESLTADLLDANQKLHESKHTNEALVEDIMVLFKAAERCHDNCLPNVHPQDDDELEVLETWRLYSEA